ARGDLQVLRVILAVGDGEAGHAGERFGEIDARLRGLQVARIKAVDQQRLRELAARSIAAADDDDFAIRLGPRRQRQRAEQRQRARQVRRSHRTISSNSISKISAWYGPMSAPAPRSP